MKLNNVKLNSVLSSALMSVTVLASLGVSSIAANADVVSTTGSADSNTSSHYVANSGNGYGYGYGWNGYGTTYGTNAVNNNQNSGPSYTAPLSVYQYDSNNTTNSNNKTNSDNTTTSVTKNYTQTNTSVKTYGYDTLAGYGIDGTLLASALSGNQDAYNRVSAIIAQLGSTDKANALSIYGQLFNLYRIEHKQGVWVIANHDGFKYENANLTGNRTGSYSKGDSLKVVSIVKDGGKTRYKLADGSYISGYHVDVDRSYTNAHDLSRLQKAAVKLVSSNSSYYTGVSISTKRHVAVIKKEVVAHWTKSFHDKSANAKRNHLYKGQSVVFSRIVRSGNQYRLQLPNGRYVTAHKDYVWVIR